MGKRKGLLASNDLPDDLDEGESVEEYVDRKKDEEASYPAAQGVNAEEQEYQDYLDYQAYAAGGDEAPSEEEIAPEQDNELGVMDYIGRGLNMTGGLIRGPLALGAEALTGKDLGVDASDLLKGTVPGTASILNKAGIEDSAALDVGGFAADMVMDPLSWPAAASKLPGLIQKIPGVSGLKKAQEGAGQGLHRMGLSKIDAPIAIEGKKVLKEQGRKLPSEVMYEKNKWGGPVATRNNAKSIRKDVSGQRQVKFNEADDLNVKVKPKHATRQAKEQLEHEKTRAYADKSEIKKLEKLVSKEKKKMSVSKASDAKSNFQERSSRLYPDGQKTPTMAKTVESKMGQGYRKGIIDEGNKARTGLGDEIDALNQDLAPLLDRNVQRAMRNEALSAERGWRPDLSRPLSLIPGKGIGQAALTGGGLLLGKFPTKHIADPVLRQAIIRALQEQDRSYVPIDNQGE